MAPTRHSQSVANIRHVCVASGDVAPVSIHHGIPAYGIEEAMVVAGDILLVIWPGGSSPTLLVMSSSCARGVLNKRQMVSVDDNMSPVVNSGRIE